MSIGYQRLGTFLTPSGFIGTRPRTGFHISGGDGDPADLFGSGHVIAGGIPVVDVGPVWLELDIVEWDGSWVKTTGTQYVVRPDATPASAEWGIRDGQIVRKVGSLWRRIDAVVEGDTIMFSASEPGAYPPNNHHTSTNYRIREGRAQYRVAGDIWASLTCQSADGEFIFDWQV